MSWDYVGHEDCAATIRGRTHLLLRMEELRGPCCSGGRECDGKPKCRYDGRRECRILFSDSRFRKRRFRKRDGDENYAGVVSCSQESEIGCNDARLGDSYGCRSIETVFSRTKKSLLTCWIDTHHGVVGVNGEIDCAILIESEVVDCPPGQYLLRNRARIVRYGDSKKGSLCCVGRV